MQKIRILNYYNMRTHFHILVPHSLSYCLEDNHMLNARFYTFWVYIMCYYESGACSDPCLSSCHQDSHVDNGMLVGCWFFLSPSVCLLVVLKTFHHCSDYIWHTIIKCLWVPIFIDLNGDRKLWLIVESWNPIVSLMITFLIFWIIIYLL